jgi:hypothetical protein
MFRYLPESLKEKLRLRAGVTRRSRLLHLRRAGFHPSLPVRRLADVASESGFTGAAFLKLDLQGHELEALAVPLIADVIAAFSAKGCRLHDIFGANHRSRHLALWQTDLVFVRTDSPLVAIVDWA